MTIDTTVRQIMQTPKVLGFAQCSEAGEVVMREGREVESLATVLGHFMRVAARLGGSPGLHDCHQASIQGKSLTVVCMPYEGGAVGVVVDARAQIAEVALMMRRAIDETRAQ